MKRVSVTVHPEGAELPWTFDEVTGADDEFVRVEVVNWNVTSAPAAFLLRVSGDIQRFEGILERDPAIEEYELLRLSERESYCFVAGVGSSDARALWETFKSGSLMTIPPATWNADGSYSFTFVGREADIQSAVDTVPDGVRVEIESVGGTQVAADSVRGRLSDRQREAVEAAVALGYYEIPRDATAEDVAAALDCAVSTVSEHLRKAEATVLTGLF